MRDVIEFLESAYPEYQFGLVFCCGHTPSYSVYLARCRSRLDPSEPDLTVAVRRSSETGECWCHPGCEQRINVSLCVDACQW